MLYINNVNLTPYFAIVIRAGGAAERISYSSSSGGSKSLTFTSASSPNWMQLSIWANTYWILQMRTSHQTKTFCICGKDRAGGRKRAKSTKVAKYKVQWLLLPCQKSCYNNFKTNFQELLWKHSLDAHLYSRPERPSCEQIPILWADDNLKTM